MEGQQGKVWRASEESGRPDWGSRKAVISEKKEERSGNSREENAAICRVG